DTSLMENNSTDQLHTIMFHAQNSLSCLTHSGIGLRKKIIQGLSLCQPVFIFSGFTLQFFIAQLLHVRTKCFDFINKFGYSLNFSLTSCTKNFRNYTHLNKRTFLVIYKNYLHSITFHL